MKIPEKIIKNNRTYIYQEQCNDNLFLYKEEKTGFRECFLLQDLIKFKNEKVKIGARL